MCKRLSPSIDSRGILSDSECRAEDSPVDQNSNSS